ncbi:acyloxyacyl hydrolase [Aquipseudomonas guryensis]|uniref:Acyloxyacyl hydrolase n=1 Tax=Aquipseudomonas guryensis TaxID=2759165 RepID=A0A7W4DEV2_9GAMM|nr:acyloxyacyl hydrolase [Pseudomonas guryensis]MBB1521339.1 acyloxyacyl hydrolase [Pseudomonas guryensis]
MKKILSLAVVAALGLSSLSAQAVDFTAAVGQSSDSNMVYRLGAQWNWDKSWMQSDVGRLTGYWDAGYTYWDGDETSSNHSLSFTPVFVYEFAGETVRPYIEAGIGVVFFENTEVEDNDLGSSFQFEDRLGVGLRFSGQEVGIRAVHYSNAGLEQPNDGVEAYTLHYRLSF